MVTEKKGKLSIHTQNIFPIIKKWLYSDHDIFLRELISNAVDAINKRKVVDENFKEEDQKIIVKSDTSKNTIQIIDYGIGMTQEEVDKFINQIAFSGAEEFIEKYKGKENIIGHFGLGFYSSFMVSKKVTIDSLSYQKGAKPAYWECEGDIDFILKEGNRKEIGTTITLYLNKDNKVYAQEDKIKDLIEKYSNFVPFPIYYNDENKKVNLQTALWNKKPKDITDEEYKKFYRDLFHDYQDPLFWIHLNVDHPFRLKGILYFPKLGDMPDVNRGKVKLYCNNVFVADDLKELVPDFMLLLKGAIDIPDIPLNVSRSFLQNDKQVKKISGYIVKKIADKLKSIFKKDRKKYEELWEDINHFIKFGVITDEKFSDILRDCIIFKSTNDDYVTIEEYTKRNEKTETPQKIYYASQDKRLVSFLNLMKEQGIEVILSNSILDNHLFQHLEFKNPDISFVRIDSEVNEKIVDSEDKKIDENEKTKIKEIFLKYLNDKVYASFDKEAYKKFIEKYPSAATELTNYTVTENDITKINPLDLPLEVKEKIGADAYNELLSKINVPITVDVKNLKTEDIPAMIVFNEFIRRYHEMSLLSENNKDLDFLKNHNLLVNYKNPVIHKILNFYDKGDYEKVKLIVSYVHDLALIEQKQFVGKELTDFIKKANMILNLLK